MCLDRVVVDEAREMAQRKIKMFALRVLMRSTLGESVEVDLEEEDNPVIVLS